MRTLALSLAFAPLSPLLLVQGRRVKRDTPRLPPARGPMAGSCEGGADGAPLAVLLVGESTVAGVGAATHDEALAGHLARQLAQRSGRTVTWRALGYSGETVGRVHGSALAALDRVPADLIVLAFGVNDTIEHTPPARFATRVARLVEALRERVGPAPVLISAAPPMQRFPNLPRPLNLYLGARAALLNRAVAKLPLAQAVQVRPRVSIQRHLFATDGFHPSPAGYAVWAEVLAQHALDRGFVEERT